MVELIHTRIEYSFTDLLGDVGGVGELLCKLITLIFGGYATFNTDIEIMKELYSHYTDTHKCETSKDDHKCPDFTDQQLDTFMKIKIYFLSLFGCIKCFKDGSKYK